MNRASSATGWVRNPVMKLPNLDPTQASSYDLGWTLNPFSGCLNRTTEGLCLGGMFPCYAYKLAKGRLRQRYLANKDVSEVGLIYTRETATSPRILAQPKVLAERLADPFYPRFWAERLKAVLGDKKQKGIFVCDMSDLFGIGIPDEWTRRVLNEIRYTERRCVKPDRFYLLTKQPQNLPQWSPFPENCEVGVTATNRRMYVEALRGLKDVRATVRFISFEPVLERIVSNDGWIVQHAPDAKPDDAFMLNLTGIGRVIIGALTGTLNDLKLTAMRYPDLALMPYGKKWTLQPKIAWVEEIVQACDKAGVPVFLKDNLAPLLHGKEPFVGSIDIYPDEKAYELKLRQEMPCGEG